MLCLVACRGTPPPSVTLPLVASHPQKAIESRTVSLAYQSSSGVKHVIMHVPLRPPTQADICAALDAPGFVLPTLILAGPFNAFSADSDENGPFHVVTPDEAADYAAAWQRRKRDGSAIVLTCSEKVGDGNGTLVSAISCGNDGTMCTFRLMSGGTSVPAFERAYWFDYDTTGRPRMVAVAFTPH